MATDLSFYAAFGGPALEAGRMNTRDLAPSFFAMGALVEASSEPYFGVPGVVTLEVRANFRRGSFECDLIATAAVVGQQLLQSLSISDLKTLLQGIGLLGSRRHRALEASISAPPAPGRTNPAVPILTISSPASRCGVGLGASPHRAAMVSAMVSGRLGP